MNSCKVPETDTGLATSNEADLSEEVLVALRRIVRAVSLHSRELASAHGLTGPQLVLLRLLQKHGPMRMTDLANRATLSVATVSDIVDRLATRKLVSRERREGDRRTVWVSVTRAGLKRIGQVPGILQERFVREFEALPAPAQARLVDSMQQIAAMMGAADLDAAPILHVGPITESAGITISPDPQPPAADPSVAGEGELRIETIRAGESLPEWLTLEQLTAFLHRNLKPYEDTPEDIARGIEQALSNAPGRGGFVLLGRRGDCLEGALVMLRTGMRGFIPANLVLFVAVAIEHRGKGTGARLVNHATSQCEGGVKLHVEYDNPARRLYERLGFQSKYAEMRFDGKGREG